MIERGAVWWWDGVVWTELLADASGSLRSVHGPATVVWSGGGAGNPVTGARGRTRRRARATPIYPGSRKYADAASSRGVESPRCRASTSTSRQVNRSSSGLV